MTETDRPAFRINEKLVWDYDIPSNALGDREFIKWYLARVLTRGTSADLREVGLATIHAYLPELILPADIRDFWLWYFNLPDVKQKYGSAHSIPARAT